MRKRLPIAFDLERLDARRRATNDVYATRRNGERLRYELKQCGVRFAVLRSGTDARLEDAGAVGKPLGAVDSVTPALRGQPHRKRQIAGARAPGNFAGHQKTLG